MVEERGKPMSQLQSLGLGTMRTALWPFGAQIAGRGRWSKAMPGARPLFGGLGLWLLAAAAHPRPRSPNVGFWRWLG